MPYSHTYNGNPYSDYLNHVAEKMGVEIINNTVNIPAVYGSGYIKNLLLEENFCVRYFNFSFKEEVEFELFSYTQEPDLSYKLFYNLDGNDGDEPGADDFHSNTSNILLYSTDFVRKGFVESDRNFRRIAIIFNVEWLKDNYAEASAKMDGLITDLATKNKSTIIAESLDVQNRFIVTQLANEMDRSSFAEIHVKTASFILLNDFLNKLVRRNRRDILSDQTLHYYTMIKVEEKVMNSIHQKLPNLDQLAVEFNLSLSTLKRHFRIVFGKNIYQYYQEKRMEWGKLQLEKGSSSIADIARHLGFFKINNFSIAFKKHFGVLPRELKHKSFIHINS